MIIIINTNNISIVNKIYIVLGLCILTNDVTNIIKDPRNLSTLLNIYSRGL
jgi:hypothetical protein